MCATCGCGGSEVQRHEHEHEHEHVDAQGRSFRHSHSHSVSVEQDLLARNDLQAGINRDRFRRAGTTAINLMSSPGSGKTSLLVKTLEALRPELGLAVIEGDQQTQLDAQRIARTGVPALQINTGKACHLDAAMVGRALDTLAPPRGLLFIENVGNLVCPAAFDLGEQRKVVLVSVTEGEDKPLKYADMFSVADLVIVTKIDLLPHLSFDLAMLEQSCQRVRPGVPILRVSSTTSEGLGPWLAWLRETAVQ